MTPRERLKLILFIGLFAVALVLGAVLFATGYISRPITGPPVRGAP